MSNELIDIEGLLKRTMDDKEIAKEVLECYLEETPETIKELESAIHNKNFKESREKSHEIKGSSASVGAIKMQKLSAIMQEEAENKNNESMNSLIVKIIQAYSDTKEKIKQLEIMKR